MNTVKVREVVLGAGRPKICVPLVAANLAELSAALEHLAAATFDLVEFRADFMADITDEAALQAYLTLLRSRLGDTPLLFTFRTFAEGGVQQLPSEAYFALLHRAAASGLIDLLDVELFAGDEAVRAIVQTAQENGVKVVLCNHDFHATPPKEELLWRLRRMQEFGADVCKIAVMPQSAADVLVLLDATDTMRRLYAERPLITMSMGRLGAVSRLAGEAFGSAVTFGTAGQASAPGQIEAGQLRQILATLALAE